MNDRIRELESEVATLRAQLKTAQDKVTDLELARAANEALRERVRELAEAVQHWIGVVRTEEQRAESAESELSTARARIAKACEALRKLTEMQSQDAGPVYCARAVDEIRDELLGGEP